jgi:hypothetical protein
LFLLSVTFLAARRLETKVNKKRKKVKAELNEELSKKKVLKDEHEEL